MLDRNLRRRRLGCQTSSERFRDSSSRNRTPFIVLPCEFTRQPIPGTWPKPFRAYARQIEGVGLPIQPYIGSTVHEVAEFLVKTFRNAVAESARLSTKGKGWKILLQTEYDFQNLFFITMKPWLPGLGREEVTIRYDGQQKTADFNLLANKIIFEMNHVRDVGMKANVAKTLQGLGTFYQNHANVETVIFAVLIDQGVELDEAKWESDYSFTQHGPQVWTRIFRNPV